MSSAEIMIEGQRLIYFPIGVEVPPATRDGLVGFDIFEDEFLGKNQHLRRVLTTLFRPNPQYYNVLHWSDGTDLAALDLKVAQGTISDDDFSGALLVEPRSISCGDCDSSIRGLGVDPGRLLFSRSLPQRLREHKFVTSCPFCGGGLMPHIVELFPSGL
jgi:hypothetical protein